MKTIGHGAVVAASFVAMCVCAVCFAPVCAVAWVYEKCTGAKV
jgi:hypothetical protein